MSERRSAFDALIAEIVDLDDAVTRARLEEQDARDAATAARQRLDERQADRGAAEGRLRLTEAAVRLLLERDGISDAIVEQLIERPLGRER